MAIIPVLFLFAFGIAAGTPTSEGPMKVSGSIYVLNWHYEKTEATFHMFFRQSWKDPTITEPKEFTQAEFQLQLQPDTFFVNALEVKFLENGFFARAEAGGQVLVSRMVQVKVPCLAAVDLQGGNGVVANCSLAMESYAHTAEKIHYQWKDVETPVSTARSSVAESLQPLLKTEWWVAETEVGGKKYSRLSAAFSIQVLSEKQLDREILKMV